MANQFPLPTPLPPPEENPAVPPAYQPPEPVPAPPVKGSPFRFVAPFLIGLAVLGVIIFIITRIFAALTPTTPKTGGKQKTITLNYWGLWESLSVMKPVIDAFQTANPNIKVNYQSQSQQDYQDRLQTAMSGNNPPDIARIHSTWLPIFAKNLLPAPANTVSATEIRTNFYPVVGNSVLISDQVYGVPMSLDGLVLFVNIEMLKQKNLSAPKNWAELKESAKILTNRDVVTNKISRAGVALGNTTNVRFWPDIVTLMLLQGGANLISVSSADVIEILTPYVSFAAPGQFWDETLPDSVVAFANEKVAMIFAPLWVVPEIYAINPRLAWQTTPIPQLPDVDPVNWSSMWIEIIPKNAPHPQEAWKFVSFLASANAQQILFETAVKERNLAQVPANKAVAQLASQNPVNAALVSGLNTAKTFYTASLTHDNETALNARLIKYLEDAVNATAKRQDPAKIAETLNLGINQVLSQYRLVTPMPTPTSR